MCEVGDSQGAKKPQLKAKPLERPPVPVCLQNSAYSTQSNSTEGHDVIHEGEGIGDISIIITQSEMINSSFTNTKTNT